jgi:hypothetical protein
MRLQVKLLLILSIIVTLSASALFSITCAAPKSPQADQAPQLNRPPIITSIYGSTDWQPQTDGDFTCVASDPDSDNLTYSWTADNGTIKGNGPSARWTSPSWMGKYNISVTVSDGKDGETKATQEVRVLINADGSISADAPVTLKMSLPAKETFTVVKRARIWTASTIECLVQGADAKTLKYTWTAASGRFQAGKGMSLEGGTASKVNWIAPGAGGDYTVNVTVADSSGNEAKGQVDFKVICCTSE